MHRPPTGLRHRVAAGLRARRPTWRRRRPLRGNARTGRVHRARPRRLARLGHPPEADRRHRPIDPPRPPPARGRDGRSVPRRNASHHAAPNPHPAPGPGQANRQGGHQFRARVDNHPDGLEPRYHPRGADHRWAHRAVLRLRGRAIAPARPAGPHPRLPPRSSPAQAITRNPVSACSCRRGEANPLPRHRVMVDRWPRRVVRRCRHTRL